MIYILIAFNTPSILTAEYDFWPFVICTINSQLHSYHVIIMIHFSSRKINCVDQKIRLMLTSISINNL